MLITKKYQLDNEKQQASLIGIPVTTAQNIYSNKEFTESARLCCKANAKGIIIGYSNSHGLAYEVLHDDGQAAWYDPSELLVGE